MKLRVKFFSIYKDAAKTECITIEEPEGTTVGELFQDLLRKYPSLRNYRKSALLAVNKEFSELDFELTDGDVVAVMPPVGGG